ncbi:MAG TPA: hypothetical protein VI911_10155 [Patescibacteria group bacterium]|nr:hypothetical protein [Patescibacteria group bacterium]
MKCKFCNRLLNGGYAGRPRVICSLKSCKLKLHQEACRQYRKVHKDYIREYDKMYKKTEKAKRYLKKYNKEYKKTSKYKKYINNRYKNDLKFNIRRCIRNRFSKMLKIQGIKRLNQQSYMVLEYKT